MNVIIVVLTQFVIHNQCIESASPHGIIAIRKDINNTEHRFYYLYYGNARDGFVFLSFISYICK